MNGTEILLLVAGGVIAILLVAVTLLAKVVWEFAKEATWNSETQTQELAK